jgi:cellulose synthase/poly-beta-1,6-N-acetylglucosamine synthase-like glycosyltransferase
MDLVSTVGFWLAAAWLAYIYAGFTLLVALVGRLRRQDVRKRAITPRVSVVIAAYNEEAVIGERLRNVLALDYPADRVDVIVAADGCTDGTEAIVKGWGDARVRLVSIERGGKIAALDAAVRRATGDLLVFTDANVECHPGALRAITANFADPEVGGVAGRTSYRLEAGSESSSRGERAYLDYDTRLKQLESFTGSVVSAQGGLYAIRRRLYRPVEDPAVTDDFAISTAVVEQGYRLVFEPEACGTEFAVPEAAREFRRRVRLMTRGLRGVMLRRRLLNPFRYGFYAVVLFSHKVLRRLAPLPLALLAVTAAWLAPAAWFYAAAAAGQAAFYALAAAGWALRRTPAGHVKALSVPFYFCMANLACAVAVAQAIGGRRIDRWQPQRHPGLPKAAGA